MQLLPFEAMYFIGLFTMLLGGFLFGEACDMKGRKFMLYAILSVFVILIGFGINIISVLDFLR